MCDHRYGEMAANSFPPTSPRMGKRGSTMYRGRDSHYCPPPAQIRGCAANALGSYLGYLHRAFTERNQDRGIADYVIGSGTGLCGTQLIAFIGVPMIAGVVNRAFATLTRQNVRAGGKLVEIGREWITDAGEVASHRPIAALAKWPPSWSLSTPPFHPLPTLPARMPLKIFLKNLKLSTPTPYAFLPVETFRPTRFSLTNYWFAGETIGRLRWIDLLSPEP
jgi:hypothetical protein